MAGLKRRGRTTLSESQKSPLMQVTLGTNMLYRRNSQDAKDKLKRRINEFLADAGREERNTLEAGRSEMLEALESAQAERALKDPEANTGEMLPRRQGALAKVQACWRKTCQETYRYSEIVDLMVGAAPEYVSLVWGAIKIVFVVQIRYDELKQNIKDHMEDIRSRFEIIDHLTAYIPQRNLVEKVTRAYDLFALFLAKALKFYKRAKFSKSPPIYPSRMTA